MTNHILEIANNFATINRLALVIYLLIFLTTDNFKPRVLNSLVVPDIHRHALCLAVALTIDKVGALIVGITIWIYRAIGLGGGSGTAAFSSVPGIVVGSLLMGLGTLLLLRILSIAKYGDIIWHALLAIDFIYIALAVLY